jgi:hypothetical protein
VKLNMTEVRKRLAIRARIDSIMGDPKDGADIQALLASEKASFTFCPYCGYRIIVAIIKKARAK